MAEVEPTEVQKTGPNKSRRPLIAVVALAVVIGVCGVGAFNYLRVTRPLQRVLATDPRNRVVSAWAHFDNWVDFDTLVFDLTSVSADATRMDVFRALLQYAEAMQDRHFAKVILAARGTSKFSLDGSYFQELGKEFRTQNPMYTIRTFPVHLVAMDGSKPFSEYEGGILGVLQKEMEQFTEFSDQWYVKDFQSGASPVSSAAAVKSETSFDPCESLRDTDPHCGWKPHWENSSVSTNAIDGTKTEFLSLESSDADGVDFGKLHYAELRICFENGKLCAGQHVGVGVAVHGMLSSEGYDSQYSTAVRLKLDHEKPLGQTWGISDSHDSLFPYGREKQFLGQLMQHNKLVLEFSYYEKSARTVTFDLSGLADKMKAENLAVQ